MDGISLYILGVYRNNSIESFAILELFKLLEPQDYGQAKRDWLKNDKTSKSVKIILTTTPRAPSNQTLPRPQIALGSCTLTYHRWQNIFQLEPTGTQEPLTGMATSWRMARTEMWPSGIHRYDKKVRFCNSRSISPQRIEFGAERT